MIPMLTNPELMAQRVLAPELWRTRVRAALESNASFADAARSLSIGRATLIRWTQQEPSLVEGLPERRGRPKKKVSR
jgi:transposase-like protein